MTEYIERANLIARIKYYVTHTPKDKGENYAYSVMLNEILNRPAADVAPVVHGHWIWHEEEFEYECSACHCRFDYNHMFELFDHGFQYANWCPNCGSKMDGGADNG